MIRSLAITLFILMMTLSGYGQQNRGLNFSSNYAIFPSSRMLRPNAQITVECWIKVRSYSEWGAALSYVVDNSYNESGYSFSFYDGKLRFMIRTEQMAGQDWNFNPGVEMPLNQWCHIAGVYNGQSIKMYLNGALAQEKYISGSINWEHTPRNLILGAFVDSNEMHYFDGELDEVRLWNRALSASEIYANIERSLTGSEDGLIAYYPMTENGDVVKDHSKNKFDGKIVNYTVENRINSFAQIRPHVNKLEALSPSSFSISWHPFKFDAGNDFYTIDLSRDPKFTSIITRYENRKVKKNEILFDNIPGGRKYYFRVRSYSQDHGYSAYSETLEINGFTSALSIDLFTKGNKVNNHFKILDRNMITSHHFTFPGETNSLILEANINSLLSGSSSRAYITVKGPDQDYEYDLNKVSNLVFYNISPGTYELNLKWGNEEDSSILNEKFTIEIKERWWQDVWFVIVVLISIVTAAILAVKNLSIVKKDYIKQLKGRPVETDNGDSISEEQIKEYTQRIEEVMKQDQPWKEVRLNVKMLAELTDIAPYQLSKVVGDAFNMNFTDFINSYRVDEVKKYLEEDFDENVKISDIAYKCGFNSPSTFFRVFKKFTGVTPQQYYQNLKTGKR
ncbi:helix-turn-helix domain-containing protein [Puteibacter caeruleilacunae]|nr:helix-turn-helix domain-containing protein [Puteibacter caeruleilacunae]